MSYIQNPYLLIKDIENALFKLNEQPYDFNGIKFIRSQLLSGTQTVIKSGDKVYYSPDIKGGEVKVLNLPSILLSPAPLNFDFK